MGWAYPKYDGKMLGLRPNNPFFQKISQIYLEEFFSYQEEQEVLSTLAFDLRACFLWVRNFIKSEVEDDSFFFISKLIHDKFERDLKIDNEVAISNLNKSLKATLNALFDYLDEHSANLKEDVIYSKFLSSLLSVKRINYLNEPHMLCSFKNDLIERLSVRKEMYQEISIFNSVSANKFDLQGFNLELKEIKKRKTEAEKLRPQNFEDLWIDKSSIQDVLNYFIQKEKGLITFENGNYLYTDISNKKWIKLMGFLVALSLKGWIVFNGITSPTLRKMLNDFFHIQIPENDNNFKSSIIVALLERSSKEHENHVRPLLPFIKDK